MISIFIPIRKNSKRIKNKIISKLKGEVNEKILVNKEKFCYPSENVSIKILKTLRTFENDHIIKSNYTFK